MGNIYIKVSNGENEEHKKRILIETEHKRKYKDDDK